MFKILKVFNNYLLVVGCVACSENYKFRPLNIELTILKILVPPRWILEPTDKAFAQGSDAKVECKADGFPKPVVTWKKATGLFTLLKIW